MESNDSSGLPAALAGLSLDEAIHTTEDKAEKDLAGADTLVSVPRTSNYKSQFRDSVLLFHVMVLEKSAFLWIGTEGLGLEDLNMAVPTPYDEQPSVIEIMGGSAGFGASMSQKLSKRFGILLYVSVNVMIDSSDMEMFIQKETITLLTKILCP
uniref:Uncharacterized protein n=1 Tax=Noctiluca scintillans TaxID=2966 RepID=A0A7S1AC38_NOCSC|mmetsp:Transcript_4038/g.11314  ORF Transcript_4038/g.11314 Transcript_4038/m.11314 type:complete len:154 (+) Transcript_4038:64-525(+)